MLKSSLFISMISPLILPSLGMSVLFKNAASLSTELAEGFQDMGKVDSVANYITVANATFWFGIGAGILASQFGQSTTYLVAVEYVNGEKSLLHLNTFAYKTFVALAFSKKNIITPASTNVIADESHSKKEDIAIPPKSQRTITVDKDNISASLTRIQLFIEDEEWERAKEYCEAVLDVSPIESDVYLYEILIDNHLQSIDQLKEVKDLAQNKSFIKALRFAQGERKEQLEEMTDIICRLL